MGKGKSRGVVAHPLLDRLQGPKLVFCFRGRAVYLIATRVVLLLLGDPCQGVAWVGGAHRKKLRPIKASRGPGDFLLGGQTLYELMVISCCALRSRLRNE